MPRTAAPPTMPPIELVTEYRSRTMRSATFAERAGRVLPGAETRSVTSYPPYPVAIAEASGSRLIDLDGGEYLDLVNNYTACVHGNAYPPVSAAIADLLPRGVAFASPHPHQVALGELLTARIASVQRIRFTNSGTEASLLAIRIAERATGRLGLLRFDGAYHGSATALQAGRSGVYSVPWNDLDAVRTCLATRYTEIGAVIAEPFLGAGGVRPAAPGFLAGVQSLASEHGVLFVLDEVQSLRVSVGGAQDCLGLEPDLTVLGKIIGGGFPIGAVGGRADLLDLTVAALASRHVDHGGTFNGHLTAAVAGAITLQDLDFAAIESLDRNSAKLAAGLVSGAAEYGIVAEVSRVGSIMNLHLDAADRLGALHLALLLEGVYTTPRGMINLSTAISADDLDEAIAGYSRAFRRIRGDER